MAAVNVTRVNVLNNPAGFRDPFAFEIEYECGTSLADDLEWRMVYVGSADNEKHDQELTSVLVGPVLAGNYKFTLEGDAPDASKVPPEDLVGVTIVMLQCLYQGREFLRIGYYCNIEYADEALKEAPPANPIVNALVRVILEDRPRVTRFQIVFDGGDGTELLNMQTAGTMGGEGMGTGANGGAVFGDASQTRARAAVGQDYEVDLGDEDDDMMDDDDEDEDEDDDSEDDDEGGEDQAEEEGGEQPAAPAGTASHMALFKQLQGQQQQQQQQQLPQDQRMEEDVMM